MRKLRFVMVAGVLALAACTGEVSTDADAGPLLDAAPPDASEPMPDASEPLPDDAGLPDAAEPMPDAAEPTPDASPPPQVLSCDHLLPGAGLSYHLLHSADGSTWDYDPQGALSTRSVGWYDASASTFAWEETYAPGHWRASTQIVGTGGIDASGDEAVSYTMTVLDAQGATTMWSVTQTRADCTVTRQMSGPVGAYDHVGTYEAAGYTYAEDRVPFLWVGDVKPHQATGFQALDGTFTETFTAPLPPEDGLEWWSGYTTNLTGNADGALSGTFGLGTEGDVSVLGSFSVSLDGTHQVTCQGDYSDLNDEASFALDRGDNGTGTVKYFPFSGADFDCALTIAGGVCSAVCSNGKPNGCPWILRNYRPGAILRERP
ncbi:hypothetical protein [Polyangium sp. 6x1]|uniref:hypothetical protein n=1 Tax=Polyangium sp. 6x1 TaxID=3042689 RepID=UPI002482AD3D|nr:hypothetical protein [Polyangium sp. 6x1]MDI1445191.1 hypothetical protein [Polyangium sp. 6x1]